ncbi:MAG: tetratricopeptide repeat protein [Hyphomicrobiales bacterium]
MRIFDLSSLIIPALAATGAVIWHAPNALAQTPPGSIPVIGAPAPAPVVSTPLPPLSVGRPAADLGAALPGTASSVMLRAPGAAPAAQQAILPGNTGDASTAVPAYAPAVAPRLFEPFKSMRDAFNKGMKGYNAGDKVDAVRAFAYAASQGHAMSSWKLARMYAEGDGVPRDDLKAFEYYSKIADEDTDEGPASPNARFIANAYVALGTYFLDGIPNTYVKADPERARSLFEYAATLFGDPDAQYNLARMLADGTGGPKDVRQAVRWLNLAAEKNHRPSQALLGHILFTGSGVPRQAAQGLMWLSLAREGADPTKDAWIMQLRDQAFAAANENERQLATLYIDQHGKGR